MTALAYNGETVTDEANQLLNLTEAHLDIGMRGVPVGTCRRPLSLQTKASIIVATLLRNLLKWSLKTLFIFSTTRNCQHLNSPPLSNKTLPASNHSWRFRSDFLSTSTRWTSHGLACHRHPNPRHVGLQERLERGCPQSRRSNATHDGSPFRYREGRTDDIPADDTSLSMVERFTHTLQLDVDQEKLARVLSVYLVLHMDHGGGNLSTFVGKAVASGHATLYSAMASSMNALSGPLHGRANQSCLEFVLRVGTSNPDEVEQFVRGELAAGRPVFGFGHAVFEQKILERLFNLLSVRRFVLMTRTSSYSYATRSCPRALSENPKSPIQTPTSTSHLVLCCTTLDSRTQVTTRPSLVGQELQVLEPKSTMSELLFAMGKAFQSTDPSTLHVTKCYDTLSDYELRSIST